MGDDWIDWIDWVARGLIALCVVGLLALPFLLWQSYREDARMAALGYVKHCELSHLQPMMVGKVVAMQPVHRCEYRKAQP